jgi:hypothetical protein
LEIAHWSHGWTGMKPDRSCWTYAENRDSKASKIYDTLGYDQMHIFSTFE